MSAQAVREYRVHSPLHARGERWVDGVGRRLEGVGTPADRNPDVDEYGTCDEPEVIVAQRYAPFALVRSLESIAQIDAGAECLRLRVGRSAARGEPKSIPFPSPPP